MGFCTPEQHAEFIRQAPLFEQMLVNDGISLTKLWFSVSQSEQRTRFTIRQVDPVRQWKLSPTDLASLDKWDAYTAAKEDMFALHRHRRRAVDRRQEQRQEARPDQRHAARARVSSTTTTRTTRWSAEPTPSSWDAHWRTDIARPVLKEDGVRFVAALLFWLVTTVALAVAIPATWAQKNVVDEDGYASLAATAAKDPQLQEAMASELTTQIIDAGRRQRVRPQQHRARSRRDRRLHRQPGVPRPVRAGQPHRPPLDVHRLGSARPAPVTGGSSTSRRCSTTRRCGRRSATQPRRSGDADRADHGARVLVVAPRPAEGCCRRGAVGEHRRMRAHRRVRLADHWPRPVARVKPLRHWVFRRYWSARRAGRGWRWAGATSTTR